MDRLRALAETDGFFTRGDALAVGYDNRSIRRARQAKAWHRIRQGAYTFPDLWPDDAQAQHRITWRAVARRLGPRVAGSHVTAALEHGLQVWDIDLGHTHVTRLDGGAGRQEAGVHHHEGLVLPEDLAEVDGRPVVNATRAALEAASSASGEAALSLFDSLLCSGKGDPRTLLTTYQLLEHWPDMQHLHLPVLMADGGSQSVGESRSRWLFHQQGLPAPLLQFKVFDRGRLVGITDFAWPGLRLLGEFDGKAKYNELMRPGETTEDVLVRERRRQQRLCEVSGWQMVRLTWADLYSPRATAERIRRMMRAAA